MQTLLLPSIVADINAGSIGFRMPLRYQARCFLIDLLIPRNNPYQRGNSSAYSVAWGNDLADWSRVSAAIKFFDLLLTTNDIEKHVSQYDGTKGHVCQMLSLGMCPSIITEQSPLTERAAIEVFCHLVHAVETENVFASQEDRFGVCVSAKGTDFVRI